MSSAREQPFCRTAPRWLQAQLGKECLAPLTGQDVRALRAFVHLVDLYCCSDGNGRRCAIRAMAAAVEAMQGHTRHLCKAVIPHVSDWGYEDQIWKQVEAERERSRRCETV